MVSPVANAGSRPEAAGFVIRPPHAPPPEGGPSPGERHPPVHIPDVPKVSYDPVKMRDNLRSAIEHLNQQMASNGRSLGFSMDDVLNRPIVTVRSTQTGEVIRQIPSEAIVKVAHTLDALKGLLHDAVT